MTAPYVFVTQFDIDEVIYQRPGKREKVLRKLLAERDAFKELAEFASMSDPKWAETEARKILTSREGKDGAA